MKHSEKLGILALRALDEVSMNMDDFSCTLTLLLQESLEHPGQKLPPRLLNSFRAEEPLAWKEWLIKELDIKVLYEKDKRQLTWIDDKTGKEFLVLIRDELEVALEDFEEQDGE